MYSLSWRKPTSNSVGATRENIKHTLIHEKYTQRSFVPLCWCFMLLKVVRVRSQYYRNLCYVCISRERLTNSPVKLNAICWIFFLFSLSPFTVYTQKEAHGCLILFNLSSFLFPFRLSVFNSFYKRVHLFSSRLHYYFRDLKKRSLIRPHNNNTQE